MVDRELLPLLHRRAPYCCGSVCRWWLYSCDLTLIHHHITQILEEAKLDSHADDLIDFMARELLATASKLQSRKDNTGLPSPGPCGQAFTNQVVDHLFAGPSEWPTGIIERHHCESLFLAGNWILSRFSSPSYLPMHACQHIAGTFRKCPYSKWLSFKRQKEALLYQILWQSTSPFKKIANFAQLTTQHH